MALYGIRYEKHPSNALPVLLDLLSAAGDIPPHQTQIIPKILSYHHSLQPVPASSGFSGLFDSGSIFSGARDRFRGLKGVENVYTQHSPRLEMTLQNLIKGRLRDQQYPFVLDGNSSSSVGAAGASGGGGGAITKDKPQDIIIFMLGGVTYEEAKMVAQVNASSPGIRVVLGGTSVHNSTTFLEDVDAALQSWPESLNKTSSRAAART